MAKITKILSLLLMLMVIIFCIGLGIGTVKTIPDNALVFVNETTKEYIAPPCVMKQGCDKIDEINSFAYKHSIRVVQYKYITGKKITPNEECKEQSGFMEEGRSLTGIFLENIGVLAKKETRWKEDGSWSN
jgi:hypothetical protein